MGRWVRVEGAAGLPPGAARAVYAGDRWIALFHDPVDGILATDDTCPHQGASLGEGTYHAGRVICPWHGWVFDARTGTCAGVPGIAVACYATRPCGDSIEVELPDAPGGVEDAGRASP